MTLRLDFAWIVHIHPSSCLTGIGIVHPLFRSAGLKLVFCTNENHQSDATISCSLAIHTNGQETLPRNAGSSLYLSKTLKNPTSDLCPSPTVQENNSISIRFLIPTVHLLNHHYSSRSVRRQTLALACRKMVGITLTTTTKADPIPALGAIPTVSNMGENLE